MSVEAVQLSVIWLEVAPLVVGLAGLLGAVESPDLLTLIQLKLSPLPMNSTFSTFEPVVRLMPLRLEVAQVWLPPVVPTERFAPICVPSMYAFTVWVAPALANRKSKL